MKFKNLDKYQDVILITLAIIAICMTAVYLVCRILKNSLKSERILKESFNDSNIVISTDNIMVLLINMSHNKKRLQHFISEYEMTDLSDIPFLRVEGVNGKEINIKNYTSKNSYKELLTTERVGYRTRHYQLTRGAIGCYLSHMLCYKQIRDSNKPFGIIFEDDAKFKEYDIINQLNKNLHYIPEDWDMLLFHCVCYVCGKHKYYYDVQRFILAHAYIVKQTGAVKLLELLENRPIEQQIDSELSALSINGKLKIYSLRYPLAVQNNMGTTIQTPLHHVTDINPYDLL